MKFSKIMLANDFKLEVAQQTQCGKKDDEKNKRKKNDVNFPKDLGNNRNEQNEIQLQKVGGRGNRESIQTLKTNHLEALGIQWAETQPQRVG